LKNIAKLIGVVLLAFPLASAQQVQREGNHWSQEISGSLASAQNLAVKVDVGSVQVEGGAQAGITYTITNRSYAASEEAARREFDAYKINAATRDDTASITGNWERGSRPHKFASEFVIQVPRSMVSVKIETGGGNVVTANINGELKIESGGGTVKLDGIGGDTSAQTGGGNINVGDVGGNLKLETGGGSIRIGAAKGTVYAETGGGSVTLVSAMQDTVLQTGGGSISVQSCKGPVKASTGGGSIELGEIGGQAEIETGGGSIKLVSATGRVKAESGGGSIDLNGIPSAHVETGAGPIMARFMSSSLQDDSSLETSAGDITVYLDPSMKVTVRAAIDLANGHYIRSDFPEIHVTSEGGQWGPKTENAEGSLNGGGPTLKIHTTTGNISILRGR
jgi:DUF4097 and DUF4098 domain-containing protein YvlB